MGLLAALVIAAVVTAPGRGHAAGLFEKNFWLSGPRYDEFLPECNAALDTIASRFATKESRFWNSALTIVDFRNVRETAYRPWAAQSIPRRFCSAQALVSDGHWHTVHYWIGEDTGMAGANWGVEWCVVGLDRNWAYNPGCKMARP